MKNKFRVWDNLNKRWLKDVSSTHGEIRYAVSDDQVFKMDYNADLGKTEWTLIEDTTVQQLTGLHDKNGNEIYEGDILKCPWKLNGAKYHSIGEVVFWRGAYCLSKGEEKESPEYCPYDLWGFNDTPTRTCFWDDAEIIGNIFEK
jgi:uncharacterized phage protein (TIGR01671 family)